jgi:predicted nucleotidyltransferase
MTSPLSLRPDERVIVERILAFHIPERHVAVFGSRANGTAKPTSDLDLCVMGDVPLPPLVRQQLLDAFSVSVLPFKVDLVEWANLTERFRSIVTASAVPLFRSSTAFTS